MSPSLWNALKTVSAICNSLNLLFPQKILEYMQQVEQIYTSCLAQGSYFIESNGEAAVIDPLRETFPYIQRAKERGVKIKYIFETHFHADFVSGHLDLSKETGAPIVYGPDAQTDFEKIAAEDGQTFSVGALTIKVLHTPGHTPESTTYLLLDEEGREHAIFTGDTLFIGDVGRPDLAQKATNLTQEDLAGWLYDSLRSKIMPLPDDVMIYPAHGAGSACGKNMSSETWDTLGNQKQKNYALRADMSKDEFIAEVTDGLMAPPQYFAKNAALNKQGYTSINDAMAKGLRALNVEEFSQKRSDSSVLVLDVRDRWSFVSGHITNSVFIGLDGGFAPWVGALITDINQKILLVAESGKEEEAVRRLARVGYDNCIGYLDGGFETWRAADQEISSLKTLKMQEFINAYKESMSVLDVRKPSEYETTHLETAINLPLDFFPDVDLSSELSKDNHYHLHCRSGYRSTVASSILMLKGYRNLVNVIGSFNDLKESGLSVKGSCPSLVS